LATKMDCQRCTKHQIAPERFVDDARVAPAFKEAARATLARLAQRPGRPTALEPFDRLFGEDWRVEEIRASGQKVVGYFCNFVPEELVIAAGAIPLRLEVGQAAAAAASAQLVPTDACPEIRSIVGAHLGKLPYFECSDLLVVPTACDGKKKVAPILGDQREIWVLELPQQKAFERAEGWHREVKRLQKKLEELTGKRIKRKPLKEAIKLLNQRTKLQRQLQGLRWKTPGLLSGADMFLVMHASFIADAAWWNQKTEALISELEAAAKTRAERSAEAAQGRDPAPPRILLTGSPIFFPEYGILHLLEEAGAEIVADEMCSGSERLHHPTVIDESSVSGMVRAAADRAYLPCTCPCFVSADDRIDRLYELAERSRAQGVVHHTLRLCHLYDMELSRVTGAMRGRDLPLLNIVGEYGSESSAMVQNRLEAFVEMLDED
jgi:benzoyl-CoA reductase/2-hydroxyglutaryl-CoA dehydratase subunit BcrC/BadD/HgdB